VSAYPVSENPILDNPVYAVILICGELAIFASAPVGENPV